MKCDSGVSWPKGNKSPSLMHDCFLSYICGEVGDGAVAFLWRLGGGAFLVLVSKPCSSSRKVDFVESWRTRLWVVCRTTMLHWVYLEFISPHERLWSVCLVRPRVMYPTEGGLMRVMRLQVVKPARCCLFPMAPIAFRWTFRLCLSGSFRWVVVL